MPARIEDRMSVDESVETGPEAEALSAHFMASDLLHAGETWARTRVVNAPTQASTWTSLKRLCEDILEPVRARFGPPSITYGFASTALMKNIHERTAPALDQHAGHEAKRGGQPICCRLGQAVDFFVPGVSSADVALWIVENLHFDRLYFYGEDRPLHVSVGPDESRAITAMLPSASGRRVPRQIKVDWLRNRIRSAALSAEVTDG
jgi:hypothetical protein